MAVWQFPLMLVPEQWADTHRQQISRYLGEDGWDLSEAWCGYRLTETCAQVIDGYMARSPSISDGIIYWGDEFSHDIHLSHGNGFVEEVRVRMDMRADIGSIADATVAIAKELGCAILIMETATLLEPDVDGLRRCARSSRAAERSGTMGGE